MQKFKKLAISAGTALALVISGLGLAGTAQAASNTTVAFVAAETSVDHLKIKVTAMNGTVHNLALGDRRRGVKRVCPPNRETILTYRNPRGSGHALAPGQCTGVSLGGTYQFTLFAPR